LLTSALRRGGVLRDIVSRDKASVLKEICASLQLPPEIDRDELHSVLIAREALCSTGIGNGFAIPHPRGPIVLGLAEPQVTLALLHEPIDYQALDKKPVSVLFAIISTTVHVHLTMLSHIMFALQDNEFRGLLYQRADDETILLKSAEIEGRIVKSDHAKGIAR
jgi:PTS system nitrogen regulatory IIA component